MTNIAHPMFYDGKSYVGCILNLAMVFMTMLVELYSVLLLSLPSWLYIAVRRRCFYYVECNMQCAVVVISLLVVHRILLWLS